MTATGADVIDLDDGNEVRGLNLDPSGAGGGIAGSTGDLSGIIDDVNILDTGTFGTQPGLELDGTTGTFAISNLTVSTNGATGVRLNNAGTVTFAAAGNISITSANAAGLLATGGGATGVNMGTSEFDAITVTGSGTGGVSMTNTTGNTTFGDLALTTTSGATPAFGLSSAGTVSVPGTGTQNVSATGGPAVDVTGTTVSTLAFDAVSSTNNTTGDGINLAALGAGTFTATSGTITGAGGIAFDLEGGSGDVSYPGALNNGTGQTAEITGRSGGAVALSGAIADTNDAGGGISLSGNTGGTTTFSNASKAINSVGGTAVAMASSDGHTLTLSGGGLDVDTTTGAGISASNSGTLVVSGAANTIDSTSATALHVTNTDIGAGGATFQRISSGNSTPSATDDPANGIVLSNTGASGGLTVSGNSSGICGGAVAVAATDGSGRPTGLNTVTAPSTADCTGGTIQNSTGDGVSLMNTANASLTRMYIHHNRGNGIGGSSVNGFQLANSLVELNGDSAADDDNGLDFTNLIG
ncbi:MAG: beta strand repeat-containing protein, partial [Thermoleophilia bacterium]